MQNWYFNSASDLMDTDTREEFYKKFVMENEIQAHPKFIWDFVEQKLQDAYRNGGVAVAKDIRRKLHKFATEPESDDETEGLHRIGAVISDIASYISGFLLENDP